MNGWLVIAIMAPIQGATTISADSLEEVRRVARRAEANFERLARRLAPVRLGGSDGSRCDEIVGRFCLTYDSGSLPEPEAEPGRVIDARRAAIEALRHAFSYMPSDFETAAPLVRYLVEDERASEAVSAARMFALVTSDSIWGPFLLGFALHAAGNDTAATNLFDAALMRIEPEEALHIRDVEWLLGSDDRGRYDDLEEVDQRGFEERLWAHADPLYLTPGNERRNEHISRHVWSRILARTPVVTDMVRWGTDLEQLTVRYGTPTSRTRAPGVGLRDGGITEHYGPDQLAYVPEDLLSRGYPPPPLPDAPWDLANARSRSGYAPGTASRLRFLPHQVSRFPSAEGTVLRVDGVFRPDSVMPGSEPTQPARSMEVVTGLFVLQDGVTPVAERTSTMNRTADSLVFSFELPVPPGEFVYSMEAIEDSSRRAARARYGITIDALSGLTLSDPVILHPQRGTAAPTSREDPAFRPAARLTFAPFDTIAIYAEVGGLGSEGAQFDVQLSIQKASRASLPSRVVSWLGERLGLSDPSPPPRLRWAAAAGPGGHATISVDLALDGTDSGNHVIVLRVTANGATAESRRIVRIDD